MDWLGKLLDVALGGLPGAAAALCPPHLKRQALARLRDHNPLRSISANHDLVRATRLAWIEAAQDVLDAVWNGEEGQSSARAEAVRRFDPVIRAALRKARDLALNRDMHPGPSPIDDHVADMVDGLPEQVAPGEHGPAGGKITGRFLPVLAALSGWPEAEVPEVYRQVAGAGLAIKGGGPARPFGELVFAAFAEIIKDPDRYPQAREAFKITSDKLARDLGRQALDAIAGLDEKLDAILAGLDGLEVLRSGALRYLETLPQIAEDAAGARQAAESADRKADQILELLHGLAVEKGVPEAPLQAVLERLGERGVAAADIPPGSKPRPTKSCACVPT